MRYYLSIDGSLLTVCCLFGCGKQGFSEMKEKIRKKKKKLIFIFVTGTIFEILSSCVVLSP